MAIVSKDSLLGNVTGRIGPVVLRKWYGLKIAQSIPGFTKKETKSLKQLKRHAIFKLIEYFCNESHLSHVFDLGYQQPKRSAMTVYNRVASYHMLEGITGEYPDYSLNLSKLKFSFPIRKMDNAWKPSFVSKPDLYLEVNWELNPFPEKTTHLDDMLCVVFYDSTRKLFFTNNTTALRSAQTFTRRYKIRETAGHEVHCWMFFVSADKTYVSDTKYLGMVEMLA